MGNDALALSEAAPPDGIWSSVFRALGRINRCAAKDLAAGVSSRYDGILALKGADCEPGTVASALWIGKAIVRLACNHRLLPLMDVPDAIQEECGVRPKDTVQPPADPTPATPAAADDQADPTRKRGLAAVTDVKELGGPVEKDPRVNPAGDDDGADDKDEPEETESEEGKRTPGDLKRNPGEDAARDVRSDEDCAAREEAYGTPGSIGASCLTGSGVTSIPCKYLPAVVGA